MAKYTDSEILDMLKDNGELAIKSLFENYYNYMCHAVYRIIPDSVLVEDIVQEVFHEIWRKRQTISIQTSLKAYLRRASINKALNHIRDQKIKFDDEEKISEADFYTDTGGQQNMELDELKTSISDAIESLPEKCRIIFSMSRFEEMTYQEIADSLQISVKTVENQISKALKIMRKLLQPYYQPR